MNKKVVFFVLFISIALVGLGQSIPRKDVQKKKDSIRRASYRQFAILNPLLRPLTISTDFIQKGDINSYLYGIPLFKGKISNIRTNALLSIPLRYWGKNSISTTISYFQQHIEITDIQSFQPGLGNENLIFNKLTVGLSATYTRRDSLFSRPVFYTATVSGLTNELSTIRKVSFLGTAVFPLKQTPQTRYGIGILINLDPSVSIPILPIFNYWHRFNNEMELNMNLPSQLGLRKAFTKDLWATLNTSISGSVAFFSLSQPNFPPEVNFTSLDVKSGLGVEYRFSKIFVVGSSIGIISPLYSKVFDQHKTSKDYFLKNKLSSEPYFNFRFSVLPFL